MVSRLPRSAGEAHRPLVPAVSDPGPRVVEVLSKAFPEAYVSGQLKAYHVPGNGMSGMSSWLK
ncbi:hypothetical protein N7925_30320 [Streptomyces sp. CA-278952]|uniref:hypothetical protein n=1 Tax=Streptomyces sp. CA-278952 TaxID=2980556 RepID=UPI0023674B07|nr:hypothetical protein [Streptomyces sp. CA-278952]WDG32325.1 hypothetical protein N7925_30320 [Streptomyces sp. CA-278952]